MKRGYWGIAILATLSICAPAFAHGGRTNAQGCHNDRKNGGYHCHGGGRSSGTYALSSSPKKKSGGVKLRRNGRVVTGREVLSFVGGRTYYSNCSAARAAGAAPIREGNPGYGRHLDRDGDGVACE